MADDGHMSTNTSRTWIRPKDDRMVAGVAAGLARALGTTPTVMRVLFVVATIWGGIGIVAYLIGWLLMPEEGASESLAGDLARKVEKAVTPQKPEPGLEDKDED